MLWKHVEKRNAQNGFRKDWSGNVSWRGSLEPEGERQNCVGLTLSGPSSMGGTYLHNVGDQSTHRDSRSARVRGQ